LENKVEGFNEMGWTRDQLVEAKARLLKKGIPKKEAEVARLKQEVMTLRQQAVRDETEVRQLLGESKQEVDKVTAEFFAGARYWGEVKGRLKKKEAEVARLRSKLETFELDEAVEADEVEGGEERRLSIEITIFNSVIGAIIGRGGENIRRIREVSQATVEMTRECNENDERRITLSGTAKQVRYARLMINDVIEGKRGPRGDQSNSRNQEMKIGPREGFKAA